MSRRFYPPTTSDIPDSRVPFAPYVEIHRERIRAHDKHDDNGDSMERKGFADPAWLSVLVEEVGEVARVLCDFRHSAVADSTEMHFRARLREELIQVAAMAAAWIDAIDLEGD
jgi:NTP pyrophosphatase (non-canonical NTP hydrolase)